MLPKNLLYGSKVNSSSARSLRTNIQPQNGTNGYSNNQTIIINVPTRRNQVLATTESYLKGDLVVRNTTGAVASFRLEKCGIHGLIRRVRVWSGSNELEDHDNYNNMAAMLYDIQIPTTATEGKFNIMTGSRSDRILNLASIQTADGADLATTQALANALKTALNNSGSQVVQRNSGDLIHQNLANNTNSDVYPFAINLISIMGSLCPNVYFPCFAATSAPIRIEIDLVANLHEALAISTTGAVTTSTFTLNNVEFVGQFIELSDQAMATIQGSLGGSLQFVTTQYKNTTATFQAQEINMALPFKYSSLKSIFVTQRSIPALNRFPFSSNTFDLTEYVFRVGSYLLPSKAPNSRPEQYSEVLKAIGSIADLNFCPAIDRRCYNAATAGALDIAVSSLINNVDSNSFYVGIDLESYSNADKSSIFAGFNTTTDDIFYNARYAAAPAAQVRYDSYACFDSLFVFENATCYRSL